MALLDDLLKKAQQAKGFTGDPLLRNNTDYWAVDPRRYIDTGATEKLQQIFYPNTAYANEYQGSNLLGEGARTPVAPNDVRNISGAEREWSTLNNKGEQVTTGHGQEGYDIAKTVSNSRLQELQALRDKNDLNPAQKTELEQLEEANKGGNGDNEFEKMVARARAAFESAIRDADYMLDRARGVRDENLGLIGKRRGEFKDLFDTGNIDITNEYQGRGGELGETAQNRRMNDAAALQAMGFGGSAIERAQNRQSRDELRGLRGLQQDRDTNKQENVRQRDERFSWADTQEGAALRAYDDAVNARRSLGEKAGLVQQGDVDAINRSASDYLGNIQARQNALAEMGKGITGFVANPLSVVIPSQADAVRAQNYSADTRGGQRGDQNVNLEEQKKKLALLNLQAGGNLYGLA